MLGEVISITTSPTVIASGNAGNVSYPQSVLVKVPAGGATVYLGGSAVATTTGFPLAAGESVSLDLVKEPLYGVVAASTQNVNVLRREGS